MIDMKDQLNWWHSCKGKRKEDSITISKQIATAIVHLRVSRSRIKSCGKCDPK